MSKDQYDVLERIGKGSFGSVYKIKRKTDSKLLVWKEIDFGKMNEKEKSQLVSEVNIIRDLKSPYIVKYYDRIIDKSTTRLYIIMEYCSNGDLSTLIAKHRKDRSYMDESLIWKIFSQLTIALKECHKHIDENGQVKPILHRDLKPANILLDENMNIKAGDFGLAKELSCNTRFAKTNVGTPLYMAPEILHEKGYDDKTDIWSLGCLLYELAALKPPFDASNAVSLAVKINTGKFNRIPSRYSDQLFDSIKLMLQLDPKKRPSITELFDLPNIQSHVVKAKQIIQETSLQQSYTIKLKELQDKEESLNKREQILIDKEKLLIDREKSFSLLIEKFEIEKRNFQTTNLPNNLNSNLTSNPSSNLVSNVTNNPSVNVVSNNVNVNGFEIHNDFDNTNAIGKPIKRLDNNINNPNKLIKRLLDKENIPLQNNQPTNTSTSPSKKQRIQLNNYVNDKVVDDGRMIGGFHIGIKRPLTQLNNNLRFNPSNRFVL